ncbi:MAG: hypothetical protein ACPGUV_03175 [Polyangiales bacterium]
MEIMAKQAKKPRDIKDLKARLGRGGRKGGRGQGIAPPPGLGQSGGTHLPAPPFLRQGQGQAGGDPFAAQGGGQGGGEVRLVIDDSAIEEAEAGRSKRRGMVVTVAVIIGLVVGSLPGYVAGGTMDQRRQYNAAIRDGRDVLKSIESAAMVVEKADRLLDDAVQAAQGKGGGGPKVAYDKLTELRSIEQPITAATFSRKRYSAFKTATVDMLFEYFNKVNLAWSRIESLCARSLPQARRADLDKAAKATAALATSPTGCVPTKVGEQILCELVYVSVPQGGGGVGVSARRSGGIIPKTVYAGQSLADKPEQYVIPTHTPRSVGVLGQQTSVFAEYQLEVSKLKELIGGEKDSLMKLQGQLQKDLGEIAKLEEVFTF